MEAMAHRPDHTQAAFDLSGRVAVVTGGTGALGQAVAGGLVASGARVVVVARRTDLVEALAAELGGPACALGVVADVLDPGHLAAALGTVMREWGRVDVLVNAAGGNQPEATVAPDGSFFDLDPEAIRAVVNLNLMGTLLPVQAFGPAIADGGGGSIINVSSAAATRPLSRVVGYGAAKAAVENATRWLADHVARRYGRAMRVNAVAPGFFIGDQNRHLLLAEDGTLTDRGEEVVARTPMGRLGEPSDLVGPVLWLASDASRFVTGAVVPVDGGFSAVAGL